MSSCRKWKKFRCWCLFAYVFESTKIVLQNKKHCFGIRNMATIRFWSQPMQSLWYLVKIYEYRIYLWPTLHAIFKRRYNKHLQWEPVFFHIKKGVSSFLMCKNVLQVHLFAFVVDNKIALCICLYCLLHVNLHHWQCMKTECNFNIIGSYH